MSLHITDRWPALEGSAREAHAALVSQVGFELPCRVRPVGGDVACLEAWAWNERFEVRCEPSSAKLSEAFRDLGERLVWAREHGLRDCLDVAESVLRRRRFGADGEVGTAIGADVLHFVYSMTRAEAVARAVATRRRGGVFFDSEAGQHCIFARLATDEVRFALALESDLKTDVFDRGATLEFAHDVVDEEARSVGGERAALPVVPGALDAETAAAQLLASEHSLVVGRDPASGLPMVLHRTAEDVVEVYDYYTESIDVDLRLLDGFPPPELCERPASDWREVLRCPSCSADLPWNDDELSCACGARYPVTDGVPRFIELPAPDGHDPDWLPNPIPKALLYFVCKYPHGLVLDCGAGRGTFRADNLINLEVFRFGNTTLVADGQNIPIRDGALDAILSAAVLEHVPDPFAYCAELRRALKPGGELRIDSAFMQPFHGCPDHYFNTTRSGLLAAARGFRPEGLGVGVHQNPWVALQVWLHRYIDSIESEEGRARFRACTIEELLAAVPGVGPRDFLIPPADAEALASGVYLHGVKDDHYGSGTTHPNQEP